MPLSKITLDKEYTLSDTTVNGEHFYQIKNFLDPTLKQGMIADVDAFKQEGSGEYETVYGNTDMNMHQVARFQTPTWQHYFNTITDAVSKVAGQRVTILSSWSATAYESTSLVNWWHKHDSDYALVYYLQNFDPAMGTVWRPEEVDDEEFMILGYENSISFFTSDWSHDGTFPKWKTDEFLREHPRYVLAAEFILV